jgi:hypothetical protein
MNPIVFLHIPKTAGQTVHHALVGLAGGEANVSPVRLHSQRPTGPQMPPGFSVYSGHIDWTELDSLPRDRFAFTILRTPRERIASFYFYLLNEARAMSPEDLALPGNLGLHMILTRSADDYFFGGDASWQAFVRDHYDNFQVSYLATRRMRGRRALDGLGASDRIARALTGAASLDGIYDVDRLDRLEADLRHRSGKPVRITDCTTNAGIHPIGAPRWPRLLDLLEQDRSIRRLESFADLDEALMARLLDRRDLALASGADRP